MLPPELLYEIFGYLKDMDKYRFILSFDKDMLQNQKKFGKKILLHDEYDFDFIFDCQLFSAINIVTNNIYYLSAIKKYVESNNFKSINLKINDNQDINNFPDININILRFTDQFNSLVTKFPDNVNTIYYGNNFNKMLLYNSLPSNLKHLIFGKRFNQIVDFRFLSNTDKIIKIEFGNDFNQPIYYFGESLKILVFGHDFNNYIHELPKNIYHLQFGFNYNKPIDFIHDKVKVLKFGNSFNQPIDVLPDNINKLTLGDSYSCIINKLPDKLLYLSLGHSYNSPIVYSNNIKLIKFGNSFNQSINNLPDSVKYVHLGSKYSKIIKKIPKSLKTIVIEPYYENMHHIMFKHIPENIKIIINA